MNRTFRKTTLIMATTDQIWNKVTEFSTLAFISSPILRFYPISGSTRIVWTEGLGYEFRLKLFGLINLGNHLIHIKKCNQDALEIITLESNRFVTKWVHRIRIQSVDYERSLYMDQIDYETNRWGFLILPFTRKYFQHRQRKLIQLFVTSK